MKSLNENVLEITTESSPELYEKVPVDLILKVWQDKVSGDVVQSLRGHTQFNVPMLDRLKSMKRIEISSIALLFSKLITFKEFEERIQATLGEEEYCDIFLSCAKELHNKGKVLVMLYLLLFYNI